MVLEEGLKGCVEEAIAVYLARHGHGTVLVGVGAVAVGAVDVRDVVGKEGVICKEVVLKKDEVGTAAAT